jgi:hypothetical protein
MKTITIRNYLIISLLALTGCAHQYVVTLTNGTQLNAASKPKLDKGTYYYKQADGKTAAVPAGRVREISDARTAQEEKQRFNTTTTTQQSTKHWYWPF